MTFLEAVARMEGYDDPSKLTRPFRNNNPGDIEWGKFAQAHGATHCEPTLANGKPGRFAVFPTAEAGFAAMKSLFQTPAYRDLTVAEAVNRYAPPVENATVHYVDLVCKWSGLTPATKINEVLTA